MKRTLLWIAVIGLGGALLAPAGASAHHSFTALYFEDRVQRIEGRLVQLLFRNPHSFVHVEAPDEKGVKYRWSVEWAAPPFLSLQGVKPTTLKVGDHLVIEGSPGRNPADHILRMRSILRPSDGWKWSGMFR